MTEAKKKPLPLVISEEVHLPVDYVILRGMQSRRAYRSVTREPGQDVWIKIVKDDELGYQLQIHVRFFGRDFWFGEAEDIDIDFYLPIPNLCEELLVVLKDMEESMQE